MKHIGLRSAAVILSFAFIQNASATCMGAACEGKDPATEGCGTDSIVVARSTIIDPNVPGGLVATLDLKWSTKCQANWGLLTNNYGWFSEAYAALNSVSIINDTTRVTRTYTANRWYSAISSPMTFGLGRCTHAAGNVTFASAAFTRTWVPQTQIKC